MGQSSSQLDQPTQQPVEVAGPLSSPMERPPSAGTTGSQALARDLERSIMDSSQDIERSPKKKSKKKRQSVEQEPVAQLQADITMTSDATPQAHSAEATKANESLPTSKKWKHGDNPIDVARRDLQKWLKRKQMQEAVLENRAKWVQMPNQKWGIKFYKPGEAPERELTGLEAAQLQSIKEEMERCRQALEVSAQHIKEERMEKEKGLDSVPPVQGGTAADEDASKAPSRKRKRVEPTVEEPVRPGLDQVKVAEQEAQNEEPEVVAISKRAAKRARKEKAAAEARMRLENGPPETGEEVVEVAKPEPKKRKKKRKSGAAQEGLGDAGLDSAQRPKRTSALNAELAQKSLKENAENVAAWLASQEDPTEPAEDGIVDDLQVPEEPQPTNKRKRVSKYEEDDEEEYNPPAGDPATESSAPTTSSGPFTTEERKICDDVFDEVLRRHNLNKTQLTAMIQNWRTAGIFKAELEHALPNRSKDQIRKFAQRKYHSHERGPWTPDQDEALRDAHAKWPGQWTKISELVDRLAGDCKDRWTKHLQFGEDKASGPWSQEEESRLLNAVEESLVMIKEEYRNDEAILKDRRRLESMISWNTVSDKVAGGRSAKRCREKYEKLKARQQKEETIVVEGEDSTAATISETTKQAAKDKEAKKLLESFELGDYFDVFVEVHSAFKDHSVQFHDEKNVLWSIVAQKNPASRFNMTWAGGALRRLAVETALAEWPIKSKKIKRKIEEAETIPAKAFQLAKLVEKRCGDDTDELPRTFKPELIGKTAVEILEMKKANKRPRPPPKKKGLSKDRVSESGSDEEDDVLQKSPPTVRRRAKVEEKPAEKEIPESSEDELASPERDMRREPSQPRDAKPNVENDAAASDTNGSPEEDEDDDDAATQEVPETQFEQPQPKPFRRPRIPNTHPEVPLSSLNSRIGMESLQSTPSLSPEAFLQRCKDAGKRQHEEYLGQSQSSSRRRR